MLIIDEDDENDELPGIGTDDDHDGEGTELSEEEVNKRLGDGEPHVEVSSGPEPVAKDAPKGLSTGTGVVTGDGTYGSTFFSGFCNACGIAIDSIEVGVSGDMTTFQCPSCSHTNTV